ncbi:anhydro-N-acetylmuramic acid kinase [Spirosoma sp. KCTC 42546]|uniref:anhydro-N-acetylmuramic acid kinase n=1 Tax=Spirosoma sp. KCTC 42546 TaxID=2520506 RepID=UPI001159B58B|nr:anhydro-N-acetylmuramic acid kinase [Spirosoma sp. KCTC 42546]QDK77322.1 anhydro-N-acetylmuramic acid kinase [Spirosoma sp. KCTC 42546]
MNAQIQQLYHIAQKPTRRIIGLMSGTSLDGLDVALCRISGAGPTTQVILERFSTVPYDEELKADIRTIFAKTEIEFEHLCLLNPYIGRLHGQMILDCLRNWAIEPEAVDIVASHGQTVYHAPKSQHQRDKFPNATLQIGDGDHVAAITGVITVSDFRQKHVAHGGEGAPLAVYGDYFMFSKKDENRLLLNMGGIANFTYLPADEDAGSVFTTDTGPGNTILDAYARKLLNKPYDEDGKLAAQGKVNPILLNALKTNPFFDAPFPKTTGPEVFNMAYVEEAQNRSRTTDLSDADLMVTLVQFSAETIVDAIRRVMHSSETYSVYMSGGGMHNPVLTASLKQLLPNCTFSITDELGISGDAKEAVLFAVLANESLAGGNTSFGNRQGVPSVTMGKVSFPR